MLVMWGRGGVALPFCFSLRSPLQNMGGRVVMEYGKNDRKFSYIFFSFLINVKSAISTSYYKSNLVEF